MNISQLLGFLGGQVPALYNPSSVNFKCNTADVASSRTFKNLINNNTFLNDPGVYVITNAKQEIIYMGKGGTIKNDGTFSPQRVKDRLANTRKNLSAHLAFGKMLNNHGNGHLNIHIFYTANNVSPALLEVTCLNYFWVNTGMLPICNKWL